MPGTGIYWAGVPAIANGFIYQRTNGLEPDVATLELTGDQFLDWVPKLDPERFADARRGSLPELVDALRAVAPATFPGPGARIPYRGDLVLVEVGANGTLFYTIAVNMFLGEVHLLDGLEPALVVVSLSDIRRWWDGYGEITENFNVRMRNGRLDPNTAEDEDTPRPLREIFRLLLLRLPGRPDLVAFPPGLDLVERELRCWGASPKRVIRTLLNDYGLTMSLNLDGSVSIHRLGEGSVGETSRSDGGQVTELHDPATGLGVWEEATVANLHSARVPSDVAGEVVIVGAPQVWSVAVDYWDAVFVQEARDASGIRSAPATRTNLLRLARGGDIFSPPAAAIKGGLLGPIEPYPGARNPSLGYSQLREVTARDEDVMGSLLGLPLAGTAWHGDLTGVEESASRLCSAQLFRYYQIPKQFAHLLPLRPRAERLWDGSRLPVTVEAFSYSKVTRKLLESERRSLEAAEAALNRIADADKGRAAAAIASTEKALLGREYAAIMSQIGLIDHRIAKIRIANVAEVAGFLSTVYNRLSDGSFVRTASFNVEIDADGDYVLETPAGPFKITREGDFEPDERWELLYRDMVQLSNQFMAGEAGVNAADPAAVKKELEKVKAQLQAKADKLYHRIEPRAALQADIVRVAKEISDAIKLTGVRPLDKQQEIIGLGKKLRDLDVEDRVVAEVTSPESIDLHVNNPRQPVAARVVDAEAGIIEVVGPLPVWLADPFEALATNTIPIPMPVRVVFGTSNAHLSGDPAATPAISTNEWTASLPDMIAPLSDAAKALATSGTGHVVPKRVAHNQTRFTFSNADKNLDGLAEERIPWTLEDRFPWRVVAPELQGLHELPTSTHPGGKSNREAMLAAALPLARRLLTPPGSAEAGTLTVQGPRPVNTNGRVTAVQITLAPGACGFHTTMSFDSEREPLPGVRGAPPAGAEVETVFGLDARRLA